jgi:Flp pilus assembly protein TadG
MMKTKINTEESGQALIELSLVLVLLCVFVFGIIDCGRAIYDVEVMKNLAGEGSSMASRGTSPAKTAQTVATYAGGDININALGCVIVTAVTNNAGTLAVTAQASQGGGITCTSKVGCLPGQGGCVSSGANLPQAAHDALLTEVSGSSIYVTEIYYTYNMVTPIPALLGNILPSQLYSAAYF